MDFMKTNSVDIKLTSYVLFSCLVAGICMFSTNYNFGVVNIPEKYIHKCNEIAGYFYGLSNCVPMSDYFWGYFASIISVGAFFGSFVSVYMSQKFGRKKSLILNNFGFIIGGLMVSLVNNKYIMLLGRFAIGLSAGVSQAVAPMYVAETATIRSRGAMGLLLPILGDIGNISSLALSLLLSNYYSWRILLGIVIIPGILQLTLLVFCVETPRYFLIFKKDNIAGSASLQKLRKGSNIIEELDGIILTSTQNSKLEISQMDSIRALLNETYRKRFMIALLVLAGQGLSGIAAMDFYSQTILEQYFESFRASVYVISSSLLGVFASFITTFYIDTLGRKVFLISSQIGVAFACVLIVLGSVFDIQYLVLSGAVLTRLAYGFGLSGVPYVIASEFFPTYLATGGSGLVMAANWLSHFIVGSSFAYLKNILGNYVFLVFVFSNLAIASILYFVLPETKGKTLEEIDNMFSKRKSIKS